MGYVLQKMKFLNGVHFGNGTLTDSNNTLGADTIFSALCIEALQIGGEDMLNQLITYARSDMLLVSDGMPYLDNEYYIPKPILHIEVDENDERNDKKAAKALKYIAVDLLEDYLSGNLDFRDETKISKEFGSHRMITRAAVRRKDNTLPYSIDIYEFSKTAGLYVCVEYKNKEVLDLVNKLFDSLQYSGLGGKRNSGIGRFEVISEEMPEDMLAIFEDKEAGLYLTVSNALPKAEEMKHAMEGASYQLVKRSGFAQSTTYSDSQKKKKDIFVFKSGSCFRNKFDGDIYDVSEEEGRHSVYRYAKPMFVGVRV